VAWLAPLSPAVGGLLDSALPVFVGVGMLLVRYRLAEPAGRVRMRWLLYISALGGLGFAVAAGLTAVGVPGRWTSAVDSAASVLAIWLLLGGITVAILRHGIFDIDVLMRRSTAYAMVWLGIAALYVVAAATPGLALGGRIPVQLAVAVTILVSLAVQPVRRRMELVADRLVFRRRASRYEVLQDFGASLERSIDPTDLLPHVAEAVREGLGASWVRVSLRVPDLATTYPSYAESGTVLGPATLGQDLQRGGELVGRIDCGPKDGGYDEADRALLDTLTGQAATAVANVWLTAQLSERVRQLDSSRARLVSAQDEERRRIERDIHDGAQQELVAMLTKLGLARSRLTRGDSPEQLLVELQSDAREVLRNLRELAQGIHPSVLSDNGLVAALRARAGRLPVPVTLRADDGLAHARLDADVEGAAYFLVCEALTNVAKHAHASTATVDLAITPTGLRMRVCDDGIGFDPTGGRASDWPPCGTAPTPSEGSCGSTGAPAAARSCAPRSHWSAAPSRSLAVSDRLRVVIAEDNYLVREGVRRLLEDSGRVTVEAATASADELLSAVRRRAPDAVITDIRMPPGHHMEGIAAARTIRAEHPGVGVVVLSQHTDESYALELFRDGTSGLAYLLKDRLGDVDDLVHAVQEVAAGGSVVDPVVVEALVNRHTRAAASALSVLTARELDVLREIAQGKTNADIEQALHLSASTVEKHVNSIFGKLQLVDEPVHRRVVAVLRFLEESHSTAI
jgi:DNA-binding NarL/FixJ family response regulator/signal transduction histidine kinase